MANLLSQEKSPYLLQHRDNPVAWRPWGEAAFQAAREQDKPIFLSIGYSTCHWCHVMAHESFEDQEVGDTLNRHFICIKVDREERPDVDGVYMSALQAISGGGGWPMSVWLTPEGKPFFAGTYYPKFRLIQLLRRIEEVWRTERPSLLEDGERLLASMCEAKSEGETESLNETEARHWLQAYTTHFQHHFDEVHGGFGHAPKFPQTMNLMVMMRQDHRHELRPAEVIVRTTLLNMLRGGMYDQLAGGFHRYSVDERWLVPHFEKMLYDQALIAVTLLEAAALYGEPEFERVARETLDYVLREMTDAQGGFYSAQDADSRDPATGHNEEGFFCTFTYDEVKSALDPVELKAMADVYGVSRAGQFEGRNILHLQASFDGTAKARPDVQSALTKLATLRARKPRPHLDDKIVTAWNGWMIWALAKAARHFADTKYLVAAERALEFVQKHLMVEDRLHRFWRDGGPIGAGQAEDYASIVHAALELHQADLDPRWAELAVRLQKQLDREFWDEREGLYFANDGRDGLLPLRPKDEYDGVTPSSNSQAALNLWRLYLLTGEVDHRVRAERIATALWPTLRRYPSGLAFLALALDQRLGNAAVAVVAGQPKWAEELKREYDREFHPQTLWTRAEGGFAVGEGKALHGIYICYEGQCLAPALSAAQARTELARH